LFTSSPQEYTVCESTVVRSKKIRIYPKVESKQLFKQYLGLSRFWFNQAISYLNQKNTKASLSEVRNIYKNEYPEWAFKCPQRIREHAFDMACQAVKNAKSKFRKIKIFQKVKFKSKKERNQCFGFDKVSLGENYVFSRKEFKCFFHSTEKYNKENLLEGTKIKFENGKWFLILPQKRNIKVPENQRFGVVALDPGVRTFISYYSEFFHGKIGENSFTKIYRLCLNLDKIISKMSKATSRLKKNLKKVCEKIKWKIKDLVDDLHHKTASFLVNHFDVILLPTFETQNMVKKLSNKTSRMMLTFAHYRFKQFLKSKAEEYGCLVLDVNEAYTSKTCSYCGKIHNIGSKKILRCDCGAIVDRDLNGSRGIYLREMSATTIQTGNRLYILLSK
jgi:putative transposase